MKKSAGEVAARVCGVGFCCLALSAPLMFFGGVFTFLGAVLMIAALVAWVVGSVISVIGVFETPEVKSHVGLGCAMALALPFGFVVMWFVGFLLHGAAMRGGH